MGVSLIQESPVLAWPAGQSQTVRVTPVLPSGRTLADWDSFVLTIREDPQWPRSGLTAVEAASADPIAENWAVALTQAGAVDPDDDTSILFSFSVPSAAGYRRYALDVWSVGGTAGDVQLVLCTWLTVGARAR